MSFWKKNILPTFFLIIALCTSGETWGYPSLPEPHSEEEARLIRRILDFWKDREYPFAKSQIQTYLKAYPRSDCADHFWAMLGDMAMDSKAYAEAVEYYDKIKNPDVKIDITLKKWQALYQLEQFTQLYQEIAPSIEELSDEEGQFYFAEAAFREALALLRYPEGKEVAHSLCKEALPFYETLISNDLFATHAKHAIAEIYRMLDQPEKAAALYLELAEQATDEHILFHAATLLLSSDPQRAASLFKQLAQEGNETAPDAAFQWLQLLAADEQWQQIVHERELFLSRLCHTHLPICYFYLGTISFDKRLYYQTVADLKKCVGQMLPPSYEQQAYLALLASAQEVGDLELCETCVATISDLYPSVKSEALFLLASAYQRAEQYDMASHFYECIGQEFPASDIAEKAAIENVRLHLDQKHFDEARLSTLDFLQKYPHSSKKADMIRMAVDLSLALTAENHVYSQLIEDLERAFAAEAFHPNELPKKRELLAQAHLKLDHEQTALEILEQLEKPDPLLLTQCYVKLDEPEKVIEYAQTALRDHPKESYLHLHLFNAYLAMEKKENNPEFAHLAAEHLNEIADQYPLSLENRLWLAHFFSDQGDVRAIPILESLTQSEMNLKRFDQEALLLATLYHGQQELEKAYELLEQLIALGQQTATAATLLLGDVCLGLQEIEEAKSIYLKLENSAQVSIAYAAKLKLARLDFPSAPEKNLKKLRELALRKTLVNEPVHLEAALDYSELKASTYPKEEQQTALLELLLQMKEAFTKQEDIWSKDYHTARIQLPQKDVIYQAYMRYLDAKILTLQAKEAFNAGNVMEGRTKQNAARALSSTLKQGKYAVSNYIKERAKQCGECSLE